MWETFKNLAAIVVLAFLIAANGPLVKTAFNSVANVLFNVSVFTVEVVKTSAEKAQTTQASDLLKEIPDGPNEFKLPNATLNQKAKQMYQHAPRTQTTTQVQQIQYYQPPQTPKSDYERFLEMEKAKLKPSQTIKTDKNGPI